MLLRKFFIGMCITVWCSALTSVTFANSMEWVQVTDPLTPRTGSSMCYSPISDSIILFGGDIGNHMLNDTWEWDGLKWNHLFPLTEPEPRRDHKLVYSPTRESILMIGGGILEQSFEIWEWKDENWDLIQEQPTSVPQRYYPGTVYDPIRDQVLVFGGSNSSERFDDLWVWDGNEWTEISKEEPWPDTLTNPGMVFDSTTEQVVLCGCDGTMPPLRLWYWDGVEWELQEPLTTIPPPRYVINLAFDPVRSAVVMHGGEYRKDETWEWDGSDWHQVESVNSPGERSGHALTYDPKTQKVMLFGGGTYMGLTQYHSDTWLFDGTDWTELPLDPIHPPDVWFPSLAYNPKEQVTVFYCGDYAGRQVTTTFEWNGISWIGVDVEPNPGILTYHETAYMGALEGIVLYQGLAEMVPHEPQERMWLYKNQTWTELHPETSPGNRRYPGLVYDSHRDRLVMYGGVVECSEAQYNIRWTDDTWEFDGVDWCQVFPVNHPPAISSPQMAFDSCRNVTVLFSGVGEYKFNLDTWEYDGHDWTLIEPATTIPVNREGAGFCFDESRCRTVMYGGIANLEPGFLETWEWDGYDWYFIEPVTDLESNINYSDLVYDSHRKCCVIKSGMSILYTVETFEYRHSDSEICPQMGVTLNLSQTNFQEGDLFTCTVDVCNNSGDQLTGYPLAVLLDVYGDYFWAPSFSQEFDSFLMDHASFPEGITEVEVLPTFDWPPVSGSASGIIMYAALLDPAIRNVIGHIDFVTFGWS